MNVQSPLPGTKEKRRKGVGHHRLRGHFNASQNRHDDQPGIAVYPKVIHVSYGGFYAHRVGDVATAGIYR